MPASTAKSSATTDTQYLDEPHELVTPPRQPRDIISYREAGPGTIDLVQNAERHLELLEDDFQEWLNDDKVELLQSWSHLKMRSADPVAFLRFHKSVHTICGNAGILKCDAASRLAAPLARLLERSPNIENHIAMIEPAINAIAAAISNTATDDDPRISEIQEGLETIVARWIAKQR